MIFQYSLFITWHLLIIPRVLAKDQISINFEESTSNVRRLKRFWTNTGFSPLTNDEDFYESTDLNTNLEIIGSLSNNGLKNVRIHWLLDLLMVKRNESYDFSKLDNFLSKLINKWNLCPTVEFMTSHKFESYNKKTWEDYSYKIISHFIEKFGAANVKNWKFETWNEPDLSEYNALNFSLSEYNDYIDGIHAGFNKINKEHFFKKKLKLRGPAGLFKDSNKHMFCWNVLNNCNNNITKCSVDIITFHRKGNGINASEIIESTLSLLKEFRIKFPNLSKLKFSNTEADPIKKWSEPRDFQSDTRYAAFLSEIILEHWKAMYDGYMLNLESISHDNSFMNYYPYIFDQRTLLARFQINNTKPKYLQFIRKPVFTALGLISNLGKYASNVQTVNNISFIVSINKNPITEQFFSSILFTSHINNQFYNDSLTTYKFVINNLPKRNDLMGFVEAIDNEKSNPSKIYEEMNKPRYPDIIAIQKMRNSQGPFMFDEPSKVLNGKLIVNKRLMKPFVINIRVCSKNIKNLSRIQNLRIRKVNDEELILFWNDCFNFQRCIKTYEIYFKFGNESYRQLHLGHIPFLYHQFKHTISGCFKVLSKDFFNRFSKFSEEICI